MNTVKGPKAIYALTALGILGLAAYGITNTIRAADSFSAASPSEQPSIAIQAQGSLTPDGSFCNPYGCAACSGCVKLQYQQTVETLPSSSAEISLY